MSELPQLLVIEDDKDVREAIIDSLSLLEIEITSAENGEDGLAAIKAKKFHAVLSDINMPKMNGLEVLMKTRESGLEVPFIVLSGFGDKSNTVEALRLGAFDFLDKPFDISHLESVVLKALELGQLIAHIDAEFAAAQTGANVTADTIKLFTIKKKLLLMKYMNSQPGKGNK